MTMKSMSSRITDINIVPGITKNVNIFLAVCMPKLPLVNAHTYVHISNASPSPNRAAHVESLKQVIANMNYNFCHYSAS